MKIKNSQKLSVVLSALLSTTSAMADDADTTAEDLGEVIVTANKIEENIKDIPASISVISDVDVEDKGIKDIDDVVKQIPNLSGSNFIYQRAVNFRGINQSLFTSTNPVVIYSDGVPQNSIFDYDVMLENIERIEVLRGPQGTLYGKDTIGGVINVISKEPDNDWSGNVGLEYGSNNYLQGSLSANGALVEDKVFLSLGLVGNQDDGWITNDYDGSDADDSKEFKLNTSLTVKPTDRLTTKLTLGTKKATTHFIKGGNDANFNTERSDFEHANYEMPFYTDNKVFSQALNVDYDFDNVKFSSLTTHKGTEFDGVYDVDRAYDPSNAANTNGLYMYQDVELNEFTQEFKLSSNNEDNRLKWVAGVYFGKEKKNYKTMGYQYYYQGAFDQDVPSETNGKTMAVFGQASYDVTDALTLTLGGRYQKIDKDIDLTQYNFPVGMGHSSSFYTFSESDDASWNAFLPKAALSYAINDDANVYFSYSKGYLPGGFNYYPTTEGDKLKFDAQTSDSYELGIRGDFLDDKITLGASIFYMDIDDIHLYDAGYNDRGIYYSTVSNGGKARSKGVELDATYRINDNWTLNGAFGVTDAEYSEHIDSNYNGNTVRMTPKYTANVGVGYFNPNGFYGRLDVNAQGSIYFDDANSYKQGAWATADVKIGYLNDGFNIYGYVKNITDEEHIENYQSRVIYFNEPRTFGIGMKYAF